MDLSNKNSLDREDLLCMIVFAEQTERFEDMVRYLRLLIQQTPELCVEERNLFSLAYKNLIGPKRTSWRIISSIEQHQDTSKKITECGDITTLVSKQAILNESKNLLVINYRRTIENELHEICNDVITLIDTYLIPRTRVDESKVFYDKMKGDYYRYLSEFSTSNLRKKAAENALNAYKSANYLSTKVLAPTNPIRLGLALNTSVFYYEILNSNQRACHLAKAAFDDAIAELDTLDEENYKDATLIMQLIRDNLTLWSNNTNS